MDLRPENGDPFFWDNARLIAELCTQQIRSWYRGDIPTAKFPDASELASKLEEYDVDGESLLTFADVTGSISDLLRDLGIKKIPQQLLFRKVVQQLQARSRAYQRWRDDSSASQNVQESMSLDNRRHPVQIPTPEPQPFSENISAQHDTAITKSYNVGTGRLDSEYVAEDAAFTSKSTAGSCILPMDETIGDLQEPPRKKQKRITPTNISSALPIRSVMPPLDAADSLSSISSHNSQLRDASDYPALSYLGASRTTLEDVIIPVNVPGSEGMDSERPTSFSYMRCARLPPGRQLQINIALKRRLIKRTIAATDHDLQIESEEILPTFGESDDEYDSDTWREIMEEEQERANLSKSKHLSQEEAKAIIDDAIRAYVDKWRETKKPRCDQRASKLWEYARRFRTRHQDVGRTISHLHSLETRLVKLRDELQESEWLNAAELRLQTACLHQTVFDIQHALWLRDVLSSPLSPPKPDGLPKMNKPLKTSMIVGDEEELSSSNSDDEDKNFVVDDDQLMDVDRFQDFEVRDDARLSADLVTHSTPIDENAERVAIGGADRDFHAQENHRVDSVDIHHTQVGTMSEPIHIPTSPLRPAAVDQLDDVPDLENPIAIANIGVEYWEKVKDAKRLIINILHNLEPRQRDMLLRCMLDHRPSKVWSQLILPALEAGKLDVSAKTSAEKALTMKLPFLLVRLFDAYITCNAARIRQIARLRRPTIDRVRQVEDKFEPFCTFLKNVSASFPFSTESISLELGAAPSDVTAGSLSDEHLELSADDIPLSSVNKGRRRRRTVALNRDAQNLRDTDRRQNEEYQERRRLLRKRLAETKGSTDQARFIINEGKLDNQGLIYINDEIARKIKPHQIDGVRFMWSQIVVNSQARQGCLLAHTMGLGKTMQVITLLVAIIEAAQSDDSTVSSQIPPDLRQSKSLIICPSGLVDNWHDECLMWTPVPNENQSTSILGDFFKIGSSLSKGERSRAIRAWAAAGGILIIGYPMLRNLSKDSPELMRTLLEEPLIVVADEAHYMKNFKSQIAEATADFRTPSRIAMTGSPLANYVMDYYAMINWVAPNYLSGIDEFKSVYEIPIKEGLYADSNGYQKRRALKLLNILKETVAPKVHRMGIAALKTDLPPKREFIIYVRLTDIQMSAYMQYIKFVRETQAINPSAEFRKTDMSSVWSYISAVMPLLAHPYIFRRKLLQHKKTSRKTSASSSHGQPMANSGQDLTAVSSCEDDADAVDLPQKLLSDVLATLSDRNIEDHAMSWKLIILMRILDESKRLGDKVLVFSQCLPTLDFLHVLFKRQKRVVCRLDGGTNVKDRQEAVKLFNSSREHEVYLISTRAGGVGLNLYGANRVVIFDFKFVPSDEQQAIGRAYRLGQVKPVYVYWLIAGGTFETTIQNRSVFKMQLASRVVDKKNPIAWSKRLGDYFANPTVPPKAKNLSNFMGKDQILDVLLQSEDLNDGIRQIMMTETFEEEDPDDQILTHEDKQEVSQSVASNFLRIQDPEEWQRQQRKAALVPLAHVGNMLHLSQPAGEFGISDRSAAASDLLTSLPMNKVPEYVRASGVSYIDPKAASQGIRLNNYAPSHMSTTGSTDPGHRDPSTLTSTYGSAYSHQQSLGQVRQTRGVLLAPRAREIDPTYPARPTSFGDNLSVTVGAAPSWNPSVTAPLQAIVQRMDPNSACPVKPNTGQDTMMPATRTSMSLSGDPSRTSNPERVSAHGTKPTSMAGSIANAAAMDSTIRAFTACLAERRNNLLERGCKVKVSVGQVANIIRRSLAKSSLNSCSIAILDQWQLIITLITNHRRIADALLAGHLDPTKLSNVGRGTPELPRLVGQYESFEEEDFDATVLNKKADPDHVKPNFQRSMSRPDNGNSHINSAVEANSLSLGRRQGMTSDDSDGRSRHLPRWAQEALFRPWQHPRGKRTELRPGSSVDEPHVID